MMCNVGKRPLCHMQTEDPDEPAHQCSLIWTVSVFQKIHVLQDTLILLAGNEGPDQLEQMCRLQMRRLIRACNVNKLHKGLFHALLII